MMYLSRGLPIDITPADEFRISLHGRAYALGPKLETIWTDARYTPTEADPHNEHMVQRMAQAGLVVVADEAPGKLAAYRLLSQCVLCPDHEQGSHRLLPLIGRDKRIWTWISCAGLRLTICELVRLEEQSLSPASGLLGDVHKRDLIDAIYLHGGQEGNLLSIAMEHSSSRDAVVSSLLHLLRAHYLLLA